MRVASTRSWRVCGLKKDTSSLEDIARKREGGLEIVPPSGARVNPLPVGFWRVTLPVGEGGVLPSRVSQTTGPTSKIHTPFDSLLRDLFKRGIHIDLEVIDDVTVQVKVKMFDFSLFRLD